MTDRTKAYWETVYAEREPDSVSWYERSPRTSLALIDSLGLSPTVPVIDVGGGTSRLAEELVRGGFVDVTVADVSAGALERAREGFAQDAEAVSWVVADVRDHDFGRTFALWHDRATFHFMVSEADRAGYLETLRRSIAPGGEVLIATFGPSGPESCSGLPVARYDGSALSAALGTGLELVASHLRDHLTPSGSRQQFLYAHLRATA
jgi:ubiquinone/menaquinone biosynthesis C-methylase UbiE